MPEGDTILLLARKLDERLSGHVVDHFDAWEPALHRQTLVGQTLSRVDARGKNLLMHFSGSETLHSHLRMYGKWAIRNVSPLPRAYGELNVVLGFGQSALLGFRLAVLRWVNLDVLPANDPLLNLGPDLLGEDVDAAAIAVALQALGELPIGVAVMRQGVMAGVGNEYKSELLFLEKIAPRAPVGSLPLDRLASLVRRAQSLLGRNVVAAKYGARQRQTRPRIGGGGVLWVYGRTGQHCLVCDDRIMSVQQGEPPRATYFCPTCQAPHSP